MSYNENKLVSIITPTFNSEDYIIETYNSLLSQSHNYWEWLVTDDQSTDSTWDILTSISSKDERVKIFKNDINSGAAVTRNKSISHANGEFIAFIDSDDIWKSTKLQEQLDFMGEDISFCFTPFQPVDKNLKPIANIVDLDNSKSFSYSQMLRKKATLGCSTVILRKSAFPDLSMPLLRTGQDYALWLKLLKQGHCAFLFNKPFTLYRVLPGSISRNKYKKALRQWEIYRTVEQLPIYTSIISFGFYAFRAVFRN